jgi:hypothetical protein
MRGSGCHRLSPTRHHHPIACIRSDSIAEARVNQRDARLSAECMPAIDDPIQQSKIA